MIDQDLVDTALAAGHYPDAKGTVIDHELFKESGRVSRHRQYRVYLPGNYSRDKQYPLIVVLHGCRQDHLAIQRITGFDAIADRVEAIIVYPFVTTYSGLRTQNCWGWWLSRQRQRGRGEVADLRQIAMDVSNRYAVDTTRRHVCGLSSGGAMAVACLAAYSDFWTSGASVAGVPYGESTNAVRANPHLPVRRKTVNSLVRMLNRELIAPAPPLLVVQSRADKMVGPKLGANLRDSWAIVSGCEDATVMRFEQVSRGVVCKFEQFAARGELHVGHLLIEDLPHGWPGGVAGKFCIPDAPNVSELIWVFFEHIAQAGVGSNLPELKVAAQ
ncbi:MAG: PHB depolymerase family esterase [Granulosicoccus sp.]